MILVNLFGGPSHLDMFDLKPEAPAEVRGEFRPIATSVPGLQDLRAPAPDGAADAPGDADPDGDARLQQPQPIWRAHGIHRGRRPRELLHQADAIIRASARSVSTLAKGPATCPARFTSLRHPGYSQGLRRAGPYGGYLGQQYDPLFGVCDPKFDREFDQTKEFYNPIAPLGAPGFPRSTTCPG